MSFVGSDGTWVLGAPEMVFGDAASDPAGELGRTVTALASTGRRTLVLAHSAVALTEADVEAERLPDGVAPVIVLTFREQVRPDAAHTLAYFATQGVGIRIISGDNPRTVAAIAREVGLDVAEGYDARKLPEDDAELGEILEAHRVFGRVTPEQKKRMVVALQGRGHTVAMTGDGVNDALAIKTADIGIAMNSGSAATKAVARLVLLDGQFSHLPDVVAEGRQVIANIERVSMLFLTKTAYATGLAILFGILVLEFPFLPRQLSITDGLTIGIPAFFLALMPNSQRYVPGFLKRSLSFAIPSGIIIAIALTLYTLGAMQLGVSQPQLRTGSTIILAIVGIWVLTVLSRPINRYKALVIGAMFIALVAIFTIPLATEFFQLVDPGEECAYLVAVVTVTTIGAIEIVRFFHRRFVARSLAAAAPRAGTAQARAGGGRLGLIRGRVAEVPRPGRRPQRDGDEHVRRHLGQGRPVPGVGGDDRDDVQDELHDEVDRHQQTRESPSAGDAGCHRDREQAEEDDRRAEQRHRENFGPFDLVPAEQDQDADRHAREAAEIDEHHRDPHEDRLAHDRGSGSAHGFTVSRHRAARAARCGDPVSRCSRVAAACSS